MHVAQDLDLTVRRAAGHLRELTDADAARRPAPGTWCAKEVIGHLVDSAAHNHQRFVRARWQDDLIFPGYAQDEWISAQSYREAPWAELLDLWLAYNLHIARVMESTPAAARLTPRTRHNLDEIAWQRIPRDQSATLEYFMADYVGHLKHHLRQIERLGIGLPPLTD
jgi:hypothetical protein